MVKIQTNALPKMQGAEFSPSSEPPKINRSYHKKDTILAVPIEKKPSCISNFFTSLKEALQKCLRAILSCCNPASRTNTRPKQESSPLEVQQKKLQEVLDSTPKFIEAAQKAKKQAGDELIAKHNKDSAEQDKKFADHAEKIRKSPKLSEEQKEHMIASLKKTRDSYEEAFKALMQANGYEIPEKALPSQN